MFASSSNRLRSSKAKPNRTPDFKELTPKSTPTKLFAFSKTPTSRDKPRISESYSRLEPKPGQPLTAKNSDSSSRLSFERKRQANFSSVGPAKSQTQYLARRPVSRSPRRAEEEIVREEVFVLPKKWSIGPREVRHSRNNHPAIPAVGELLSLSRYEPAKHSTRQNGLIRAYAACTNHGPVREENEDRVAIILNFNKPEGCADWKKAAYFGVFDGHGGVGCADYLRDCLHTAISREKKYRKCELSFPGNIPDAMSQAFYRCEASFLERCRAQPDKSGSCAICVFVYGDSCYIANTGDSRAIMSSFQGDRISELSLDHKPSDEHEQKRILEAGGKIYQTKLQHAEPGQLILYEGEELQFIMGPHRVLPGRLSVTRTFGDIEAKLPEFGGNPRAIISTPEIRSFKLTKDNDFIIIGCDGIFDRLSNDEIIECVWETAKDKSKFNSLHEFCGVAAENIMKLAVYKRTLDNITVVMLAFEGMEDALYSNNSYKVQKVENLPLHKIDSTPKNTRSTTYFQNSSSQMRKSIYDKRPSRQSSTSRSSIKKQETSNSKSVLQNKPKKQTYLKSPSPNASNSAYKFFGFQKN